MMPSFIKELESIRQFAMLECDVARLEGLLSSSLTYIHSTGLIDDKDSYLALLAGGDLVYKAINTYNVEKVVEHDSFIQIIGSVAFDIMWYGEKKFLGNKFIATWIFMDGRWQMLSWQSTALALP